MGRVRLGSRRRGLAADARPELGRPGCGYAHGWTPILLPPRRLPPATKGRLRRRSLRRRLEARLPLLAGLLEQAEVTRRPGYFRGE